MDKQPERSNDDARWQAVLDRDERWDGQFVYGVRSTGIYCRPSCPSRRPSKRHVVFFPNAAEATQAGFRACLRCTPDAPRSPAFELVEKARQLIDSAIADGVRPPGLRELGEKVSASPFHLQRKFQAVVGMSPRQYAAAQRALKMKASLRDGNGITRTIYEAGYESPSRFYETAERTLGMRPGDYQRGGAGMKITYTIIETSSPYPGCLLLAATDRGICSVQFGDSPTALENALASEFPKAERTADHEGLREWAGVLRNHLAGQQAKLDLPLDVRGTAFQQRVWAELRKIPYGQTRTYSEIAEALQQPTAARAVARACATNPAALVIPCHRVVRAGGALAGYRWGIARKKALLEREKAHEQENLTAF